MGPLPSALVALATSVAPLTVVPMTVTGPLKAALLPPRVIVPGPR